MRVVVVNRGEIAVRIVRTARARGYRTLVVHTGAEREAPQVRLADEAVELPGEGVPAYLDIPSVVAAATRAGRGAVVHPGYGFLSENPEFARACAEAGLVFVGPDPGVLATFGDKVAARAAAERAGLPVLPGTAVGADLDAAAALLATHPDGVMVKAAAGGGGRGLREVRVADELAAAWAQCRDEARAALGGPRGGAGAGGARGRPQGGQGVAARPPPPPGGGGGRR
uniref:biotin carboxylase N-terminal domain-containing protein n=1 Tax=Nocardia farcinica TaxID=37329 RepID=UPI0024542B45